MPRRTLEGIVVSTKADKTVTVLVTRSVKHPLVGKIIKKSKKYLAHDEANECEEGAVVTIAECAPRSKRKTWEIVKKTG